MQTFLSMTPNEQMIIQWPTEFYQKSKIFTFKDTTEKVKCHPKTGGTYLQIIYVIKYLDSEYTKSTHSSLREDKLPIRQGKNLSRHFSQE